MKGSEAVKKVLKAFQKYYSKKQEGIPCEFFACYEFHAHGEQFFLVKAAKVADIDSNEYVFFAELSQGGPVSLPALAEKAWECGLSFIKPYFGHKNSDISLVVFSDSPVDRKFVKKIHYYKSYKLGLFGWSAFNLAVCDLSGNKIFFNYRGRALGKNLQKILIK